MGLTQLHPEGLPAGFPLRGIRLLLHTDVLHHQVHDTEQDPAGTAGQAGGEATVPPEVVSHPIPAPRGYLSSVLSAREMAGFRRALLQAWLFLQGRG